MQWRKILIGSWSWKRPFYSLGFVYLSLALVAFFAGDRFIFHPPGTPYPEKEGFLTLPGNEQVAAYYHPPQEGGFVLLCSHGNAQNLGTFHRLMDAFAREGYGVCAYDYPGYGETPGSPSEEGCYRAAQCAYDYLVNDQQISPDRIILCGQSVGAGPTTWLATQVEHRGVVLLSPFLSAFRTVTHVPLFPGDRFPNLAHVSALSSALLIVHGERDEVVPHAQGKALFEASPSRKKVFLSLPETGHNDLFRNADQEIFEALRSLFPCSICLPPLSKIVSEL